MKKNRFAEFFKGKGYYVLLFVGVVAIAAVAIIGSQLSSNPDVQDENYVDINDTDNNIADNDDSQLAENNPVSEGIVNNVNEPSSDTATNDNEGDDLASSDQIEYEDYSNVPHGNTEVAQAEDKPTVSDTQTAEAEDTEPPVVETTGTTVQAENTPVMDSLSFKADDGLAWPVNGNVIMNYSMDHTIYHATLMQYKCNPAVIIDAEVGTEVKAAAKGVVSSIDTNNAETGYTITMSIGDKYSLVYGQLDNVTLAVGDKVNEGEVIGTIAEPTKYYTLEGSNLYFQVLQEDDTVNPMLLLR